MNFINALQNQAAEFMIKFDMGFLIVFSAIILKVDSRL